MAMQRRLRAFDRPSRPIVHTVSIVRTIVLTAVVTIGRTIVVTAVLTIVVTIVRTIVPS